LWLFLNELVHRFVLLPDEKGSSDFLADDVPVEHEPEGDKGNYSLIPPPIKSTAGPGRITVYW
jgi:hypothetical protein